jgi:predicted TIM-barrel fold metal-dependent hydrolase
MSDHTTTALAVDVHQHLWPEELVDRLRSRSRAPYLRDWTLHTDGEPAYDVDPAAHDVDRRIEQDHRAGVGTTCLSLSSPLGIESLSRPTAQPLLDAWHRGVRALPDHYRAWASVSSQDPDLVALRRLLADDRFVGLQVPATDLLAPGDWERAAGLLLAAEQAGKPVFVHPGAQPRDVLAGRVPQWWAPVVGYTSQLQAAWWGWQAVHGRALFPQLRLVFAAGAGLAPVHVERHAMRGGGRTELDPLVQVDTSGTGTRALEALVRVLGIDALVLGSDAPYAEPLTEFLGDAATHAVRVSNPARLLTATPVPGGGAETWAVAS